MSMDETSFAISVRDILGLPRPTGNAETIAALVKLKTRCAELEGKAWDGNEDPGLAVMVDGKTGNTVLVEP